MCSRPSNIWLKKYRQYFAGNRYCWTKSKNSPPSHSSSFMYAKVGGMAIGLEICSPEFSFWKTAFEDLSEKLSHLTMFLWSSKDWIWASLLIARGWMLGWLRSNILSAESLSLLSLTSWTWPQAPLPRYLSILKVSYWFSVIGDIFGLSWFMY